MFWGELGFWRIMCVFCTVQKRARGIAMMLPWLVIPLIGMWALSQLLPPPFRFEITSPRIACVAVLLFTLLWYEVLMPQLLAWTVRRNAWLREKKRLEAIELQKLKKSATRRCRNCFTAYKDQNPGGGRFMCSYCGHFSKRPVLDLPVPPDMMNLSSGILKDFVGKSGHILNAKSGSDNGWICNGQGNIENANWTGGFSPCKSVYWRKGEGVVCGMKDCCTTKTSYSYVVIFAYKLLRSSLSNAWWVWRKVFRVGLSDDDISVDEQHGRSRTRRSESGINFQESRSDKARRKAEEKRQARLEKEQLEEEERKQREEIARLVEERRKLRNESEKDQVKRSGSVKERQKKEAEKKRQVRKKESDWGSCKSNSDVEDLERKAKEHVRKTEPERKGDTDRCAEMNIRKGSNLEPVPTKGVKGSYSKSSSGTRYLDRVRGTFLSSSKAFSRGSLFARNASNHPSVLKENRFGASMGHSQTHANQKSTGHPDHSIGSIGSMGSNGSDGHIYKPVFSVPPSTTPPKKSWGQLFSCSSTVVPSTTSNVISSPHAKDPLDIQKPLPAQPFPAQSFGNPLDFGLPSPFTLSAFPKVSINTCSGYESRSEYIFPLTEKSPQKLLPEEPEIFEDPCYVPDPVSLLGPVSESLDNFQLDLCSGFGNSSRFENSFGLNNVPAPCEVVRPSPIESPQSRLRVHDNRHTHSSWPMKSQKAINMNDLHADDTVSSNEKGTWQMWNSSPLVEDGMIGGSLNWLLYDDLTKEENVHQPSLQCMGLLSNNDHVFSSSNSPVKAISHNSQSGGDVTSSFRSPFEQVTLLEKTFSPRLSDSDNYSGVNIQDEANQNEVTFGSNRNSATSSPFDHSPVNSWSKNQWDAYGSGEGFSSSSMKPPVGGLFSDPDVQSLWSAY